MSDSKQNSLTNKCHNNAEMSTSIKMKTLSSTTSQGTGVTNTTTTTTGITLCDDDDLKTHKNTVTPTTISGSTTSIMAQLERRPSLLSVLTGSQDDLHKKENVATSSAAAATSTTTTTTTPAAVDSDTERNCWICFASDEDNRMAAWVQPCKCRGTTKWVHQSCLYRWIDEKQKGNALRTVSCQQCQTEYIIVFPHMGKVANILESVDNFIKRLSPFLAAGIFVGSLYWTAVTYGAVTFLQIVGHKKGLALMENGDPLILLLGLPAIPVGLVLGRMIRWEDAIIRLIRNRRNVARKFPLMNLVIPYPEEEDEQTSQNPATPTLSDPVSATRVFCGALLLPTISSIVGRLLFESIDNTLHRTLLGGLTFITVKGILKIYLKQQQYTRKKKRRIIDYTEDNVRTYVNRNTNTTRQFNAAPAAAGTAAANNSRPQAQQAPPAFERDFMV